MTIDVQKLSLQIDYILAEHWSCDQKCLGDRKIDMDQHRDFISYIIAYYALGMSHSWDT